MGSSHTEVAYNHENARWAHTPTHKQSPSLFTLIREHRVHSWLPFIFSSS